MALSLAVAVLSVLNQTAGAVSMQKETCQGEQQCGQRCFG